MLNVKVFFRSTAGGVEYRKLYNAKMQTRGKTITIRYDELDENGRTETEVVVVDDDFVTVRRMGQFSNYLEFKENHSYVGEYLTPYGKVSVEAFTKFLKIEFFDGLPQIEAKYNSSLMGEESENEFLLKVRKI